MSMEMYLLVDKVVESFRPARDFDILRQVEVLHIVRAISLLPHKSLPGRSKGLNGILLPFLHLLVCLSFNTGNSFPCMDLVGFNRMSIQISNCFHG